MFARGVEHFRAQNHDQAQHWFKLAAEKGNANGQYMVGLMHVDGKGVPQDYAQARHWFQLGAKQGHAGAQYNLG